MHTNKFGKVCRHITTLGCSVDCDDGASDYHITYCMNHMAASYFLPNVTKLQKKNCQRGDSMFGFMAHRAGHLDRGDLRCSRTDNEKQRPRVKVALSAGRTEGRPLRGSRKGSEVTWRREDRPSYGRKILKIGRTNARFCPCTSVILPKKHFQKQIRTSCSLQHSATCSKYADKVLLCSSVILLLKTDSPHGTACISI